MSKLTIYRIFESNHVHDEEKIVVPNYYIELIKIEWPVLTYALFEWINEEIRSSQNVSRISYKIDSTKKAVKIMI